MPAVKKTVQHTDADVFTAIAHPVRRQILELLMQGPLTATALAAPFDITRSAVSQHLHAAVARETAAGEIRPMPQHLMFNTWIGLVHHYILNQHLFSPNRPVLKEHGPELVEHFLRLLAKEDS